MSVAKEADLAGPGIGDYDELARAAYGCAGAIGTRSLSRLVERPQSPATAVLCPDLCGNKGLLPAPQSRLLTFNGDLLVRAMASTAPLPTREPLTARELEILQLISEGLSNKQIATRLHVSMETVKSHVSALFAKLDATSRAHAVAVALRRGLLR